MSTELTKPPVADSPPSPRAPIPPLAKWLSTWFGLGLMPVAPGTMGTIGAVPLAYLLGRAGTIAFVVGFFVIVAIGTWAADRFVRATGQEDDQRIVIDEVAGYLLTLIAVPRSPGHLLVAFGLFRLFDIWKPQPVRWVDDNVKGGLGVMADDLAAGVYAALFLLLLDAAGFVRWLNHLMGVTP